MVAIARAVSINAKLVIMDEPTSSLDRQEVSVLFRIICQHLDQGRFPGAVSPDNRDKVPLI